MIFFKLNCEDVKELLYSTEHLFKLIERKTSSTLLNTQITNETFFFSVLYIFSIETNLSFNYNKFRRRYFSSILYLRSVIMSQEMCTIIFYYSCKLSNNFF